MSTLLHWLSTSQDYFHGLGWQGMLLFAGVIFLVQMFVAPLSPVAITAGLIFGLQRGYLVVTLGTAIGAAVNFLMARYLARGPVARRIHKNEKFRLIDHAIGQAGWKIIALLRFCPIPFGFANYCYGLTAIHFWPYFFASLVAIIPGNFFFTWMGATAQAGLLAVAGESRPRHPMEYVLMVVGL
ncbi:MAG: TVP38/TMEM64 family protein, partial [Chthoniobacteraceae bacterium]